MTKDEHLDRLIDYFAEIDAAEQQRTGRREIRHVWAAGSLPPLGPPLE